MTNYSKQRYIVAIWSLGRFAAFRDLWKTISEIDKGQDFAQIEKGAHVSILLQFCRTEVETCLDCKADEIVHLWFLGMFSGKTGKIRISHTLKKLHTSLYICNFVKRELNHFWIFVHKKYFFSHPSGARSGPAAVRMGRGVSRQETHPPAWRA